MNDPIKEFGFKPENYRLLFIGLGINVLGFLLMIGGGADNPNEFDGDALFSHMRITVAPILITLGYGIMIFSIMKKPSKASINNETSLENSMVEESDTSSNTNPVKKKRPKKGKR